MPRIDEDGDRRRHVSASDQVVEHRRHAPAAIRVLHAFAVLKHHQRGGFVFAVLSGHINRPIARRVREDVRFEDRHLLDGSLRHAVLRDRIGMRHPLGLCVDDWIVRADGVVVPQPLQSFGQQIAAELAAVSAVGHVELVLVARELQSLREVLIADRPIAVQVVKVLATVLQIDLDGLWLVLRLAHETGIGPAAANVGEAADVTEDLAELLRLLPSEREGADAARRDAAGGALRRVARNIEPLQRDG